MRALTFFLTFMISTCVNQRVRMTGIDFSSLMLVRRVMRFYEGIYFLVRHTNTEVSCVFGIWADRSSHLVTQREFSFKIMNLRRL